MISFDADICSNYDASSGREWLETNGVGGFASGTIAGANTRRYHALLTAATKPPLGRVSMLSKFEETLFIDGKRFELSTDKFPGTVYPEGYKLLRSFRLDPFPIWIFDVDGIEVEKRVFMPHGKNAVVCSWRIANLDMLTGRQISLELRPLLSFVDYHHLQHTNDEFDGEFKSASGVVTLRPYSELPSLFFTHNAAKIEKSGFWYRNFEYAIEKERGFDYSEDLFQPFVLKFALPDPAHVIAASGDPFSSDVAELENAEIARRKALIERADTKDDLVRNLVLAADQFIVERGDGNTVIAGYPWFSDWGRDTMIALNGLTLATGRHEIARRIIVEFSGHISRGMLPNRFPDEGEEADYNTVDATLWYFDAIRAYLDATSDLELIEGEIYAKLAGIIDWHLRGTRFNIHVDTDGLLYAGDEGVQLTWMDAKIGDLVITPRTGKPVEIQALWYNALKIMADLALRCGKQADLRRFNEMAELCKQSFNAGFWNENERCLFDVIETTQRDASVRPNQIFAASLKYSMLDEERARLVVDKVEADLLTPVGLRSLSPRDPRYCPVYIGAPFDRDSAYHQGTVWAWLIGGFVDGYRRVYPDRKDRVREIVDGFRLHLTEAGVGQISEIFDAESPHAPRGCFAQAWSVAELLRIVVKG
jgi:predicted glycogen debranching enzyme